MDKDKHVIWNNDSIAHDGQEECIKGDWICEVQAAFGLCDSSDIPIPSGLVNAVKEAAIDDAIANAMENHEETINFIQRIGTSLMRRTSGQSSTIDSKMSWPNVPIRA